MEEDNERSFNCAESVMIRVDRESSLPGFNDSLMRVASVLGDGFVGSGEVCGAASGGVLCLALMTGTRGTETVEEFKEKRRFARSVINDFMNEFANDWGSVECKFLPAMDSGQIPTKGLLRNKPGKNLCEEYVDWCTEKVLNIRKNLNI
ncbi:MAG: C-GCAxxG-C-C family (seleno)protein [Promethearchaeota archaeon]